MNAIIPKELYDITRAALLRLGEYCSNRCARRGSAMCSTCALRDIAKLRRKWEGDTYVRFVPKVRTKRRGTGRLFSMQERDVYRARILEYITSISPRWISRKGMIEYLCSILPPDKSRAWPRLYYWTVNQPCIERRKVKGRIASIRKKQKEGDSNGEKT